jgi:Bacterial PH domain
MSHEYSAPWSRALKFATLFTVLLLCAASVLGYHFGPRQWLSWRVFTLAVPLLSLVLGILFMVRGYRATAQGIEIERFGWATQLPLAKLLAVTADPLALTGSIRRLGNGGFFAITGIYSNQRHGRFRAWATDPSRAVVLKYADHTVILTPDDPGRFVQQVQHLANLPGVCAPASG